MRCSSRSQRLRAGRVAPAALSALVIGALFLGGLVSGVRPASAAKTRTYRLTNITQDFVTIRWTLQCAPKGTLDLAEVSLSEAGMRQLADCIAEVEVAAPFQLKSRSRARRSRAGITVISDKIKTVSRLTAEQVAKIKAIVEDPALQAPRVRTVRTGPSRLISKSVGGELEELVVTNLTPGLNTRIERDGDLFSDNVELFEEDFAQRTGTQIADSLHIDESGLVQDAELRVAPLTAADVAQITQILEGAGRFIVPDVFSTPFVQLGQIDIPGAEGVQLIDTGQVRVDPLAPFDPQEADGALGVSGSDPLIAGDTDVDRDGSTSRPDVVRLLYLLRGFDPTGVSGVGLQVGVTTSTGDFVVPVPDDRVAVKSSRPFGRRPLRISVRGRAPLPVHAVVGGPGGGFGGGGEVGGGGPIGGPGDTVEPVGTYRLKRLEIGASGWTVFQPSDP